MCSCVVNKNHLFLTIISLLHLSTLSLGSCDIPEIEDLGHNKVNFNILDINDIKRVSDKIINLYAKFTKMDGAKLLCRNGDIINYNFSEKTIDPNLWTVEQYIPGEPDWQFNIFQNTKDVVDVVNNTLRIKPVLKEENCKKNLDLNPGCTRSEKYCSRVYRTFWNLPVVSGKIQWKTSFRFGNVTIRAQLPIGDYIYPEIYLEDINDPERRILIAYARGNKNYEDKNGTDMGGSKLFGGPYVSVKEPIKSKYLSVYESAEHIGSSWHIFSLIWTPDNIDLYIDGTRYGHIDKQAVQATKFDQNTMVRLVLGVGVGGPHEFPDNFKSSGREKPYQALDRDGVKKFTLNKNLWFDTWNEESQLFVDYVVVKAL